jgi:hypothetical protein
MLVAALIPLIEALPKVVASAPEFINLFHEFIKGFSEQEQEELKDAYQRARSRSDEAQAEFEQASRGEEDDGA